MASIAQITRDVNDAIIDALTPNPIRREDFKITLKPKSWAGKVGWRLQLTAIRRELKPKYKGFLSTPTTDQVNETYDEELSETRGQLIDEIRALPAA